MKMKMVYQAGAWTLAPETTSLVSSTMGAVARLLLRTPSL